jgi:hypothetical protein
MTNADGTPNHKAPALAKYKQDLAKKAELAILGSVQPAPAVTGIVSSEQVKQLSTGTEVSAAHKAVQQMNSLTFATSANKDDIFGGFKSLSALEENKSAGRL